VDFDRRAHAREVGALEALRGRRYYAPTDSGRERAIKERLEKLRTPPESTE